MRLNNVYFLPNDDPLGWTVISSVNREDSNDLGSFVTVALHGTKAGQLDFDYQISVSKNGDDILVSMGRSNNTGGAVDVGDMDYFVSSDARLGGSNDRWIGLGTRSRNRDYYDLSQVAMSVTPTMYEVNQVVRDMDTGNSLLMGHVTTLKGASRFEVLAGWRGSGSDRMQVRGFCSYKVTMPAGRSFPGEELLVHFSGDAIRAMEHQADLIAIAHNTHLKQRRPINLDDRELVANNYSRYHGWMSGGTTANAERFFKENGLYDFYYGLGGPYRGASWGVYALGARTLGGPAYGFTWTGGSRIRYPDECYLPVKPRGADRVIDFSNPLTIKLERERAFQGVVGHEKETGRMEQDYADSWDKWPGQYDPYMRALEPGMPVRPLGAR